MATEILATSASNLPHKHIPLVGMNELKIVQFGAGGNGGYLLPPTARLLRNLPVGIVPKVSLVLVDGDVVEPKNINRQQFINEDIGKNKAQVLAERYGNAFNLPDNALTYIPEYLIEESQLTKIIGSPRDGVMTIIIDCVDKTTPRSIIQHWVKQLMQNTYGQVCTYVISVGNSEWIGQAAIGAVIKDYRNGSYGTREKRPISPGLIGISTLPYPFSIPLPYDKYPTLVDRELDAQEEQLSCADRAAQNVQYLATNNIAAALAFNYLNNLITNFVCQHEQRFDDMIPLTTGTVYFDARTNSFTPLRLTDGYFAPPATLLAKEA